MQVPEKILLFERFTFEIECTKEQLSEMLEMSTEVLKTRPDIEHIEHGRACIRFVITDQAMQRRLSDALIQMGAQRTTGEYENHSQYHLN